MLKERASYYYGTLGKNCAEGILLAANEVYGLKLTDQEIQLFSGFGRGMGCGSTCGGLSGAIGVLSRMYGGREDFRELCGGFVSKFKDALGCDTIDCGPLAGKYKTEAARCVSAVELTAQALEEYIAQRRADMEATGDGSIQFELTSLEQALMMLEQRTQDLRTAESVAMQSIPMIKTMQFSNMNLVRKINSAFIITLPVFKQALTQAIMLKRQRIQAEAMSALDAKTNEMLIRNAQNTAEQSKMTARLASGSSIKIETLEKTWQTIVKGIDETRQIQENARKQRVDDQKRLETIKAEFNSRYHMPK